LVCIGKQLYYNKSQNGLEGGGIVETYVTGNSSKTKYKVEDQTIELPAEVEENFESFKRWREVETGDMPTCWERIREILYDKGETQASFGSKMLLNPAYLTRIKSGFNSLPSMRTIMAIAVGYKLRISEVNELMLLAGHTFSPMSEEHDIYKFSIVAMRNYDIYKVNKLLRKYGYKELGAPLENKKEGTI